MELGPVDRITVGAVGEPGERTFYLQARRGEHIVTLLVEKQQVQLLSATVVDILSRLGTEVEAVEPTEEAMALEEPLVPDWRAGRLAIGYEEDRDLLLLEAEEVPEDEEDEEQLLNAGALRLWATREQMLALARHGVAVAAAGRPTCEFCGNPIDPEGHVCVAMNGHGDLGRI